MEQRYKIVSQKEAAIIGGTGNGMPLTEAFRIALELNMRSLQPVWKVEPLRTPTNLERQSSNRS